MNKHSVFIALGSNLGDRGAHISQAAEQMAALQDSALRLSSVYETDPMGPQNQPDYLNAVCQFEWLGTALDLLGNLQSIERAHGRIKTTKRWTARPLDLDILLFGQQQIDEPGLQIPHTGVAQRSFVLWPLAELAPGLLIPGLGAIEDLLPTCEQFGIRRIS